MAVSMLARNEKMVRPAVEIPGQMPEAQHIIIETKNLSVFYGEKAAIQNVSLAFPEHQVTALIGPSGCGKSTFLRSLNRMNDEIAGCRMSGGIFYKGADITLPGADVFEIRKHIGMVFQRPNPFAKSVFENVAFGPKHHGVKKKAWLEEIVEESLKKAALWDEVKDRLHTSALALSGGQQQRLCIARALAMNPDVLLLDEPASALDPVSTGKIEELILELKKDYTVAIVTHNLQQAARISDKTAFFFMGALIEAGDTAKIFTKPENQKTRDYLSGFFG
mgnify:FL=1